MAREVEDHLFCFRCGGVQVFHALDDARTVFVCDVCRAVRDLGDDFDEAD